MILLGHVSASVKAAMDVRGARASQDLAPAAVEHSLSRMRQQRQSARDLPGDGLQVGDRGFQRRLCQLRIAFES